MLILEVTAGVALGECIFATITTLVSYAITKRSMKARAALVSQLQDRLSQMAAQGEVVEN